MISGHVLRRAAQAFFGFFSIGLVSAFAQTSPDPAGAQLEAAANEHLSRMAASTSIVTKTVRTDGQLVDCVDIDRQPAHSHPQLRRHRVQREPSPQLLALMPHPVRADTTPTNCPAGSVEMVLPSLQDIVRAGSLRSFLGKYPVGSPARPKERVLNVSAGHEYAASYQWLDATAAQSTFNVWTPSVERTDFSLTQLWLAGGADRPADPLQTVETGSQVYPDKYGNTSPTLFIYWTADGYDHTGCYNLDCAAFVQTSNVLPIGGSLSSSTSGGTQMEGTLAFYRDPANGNWVLFYFDGTSYIQSGYYPSALFGTGMLSRKAQRLVFGGEVAYPLNPSVTHTTTAMGSGAFPRAGYGAAMYQRGLKYMTLAGSVVDYPAATSYRSVTNAACYDITMHSDAFWGGYIFFGGPGYSAQCPRRPQ